MNSIRAMFSLAISFLIVGVVAVLPTVVIGGEYGWYSALEPGDVLSELGFYLMMTLAYVLLAVAMTYFIATSQNKGTLLLLFLVLVLNPIGTVLFFRYHLLSSGLIASGLIAAALTLIGIKEYDSTPAFFFTYFPYYVFSLCAFVFNYVLFMLN